MTTREDDADRWEESRSFYEFVKDQVIGKIKAATFPLVRLDERIRATAFVVEDGGRWFLVSAAHVLAGMGEAETFIPFEGSTDLLDVREAGRIEWLDCEGDEPGRLRVDVGVVHLAQEAIDRMSHSGVTPFSIGDARALDPRIAPDVGYAVYGFPTEGFSGSRGRTELMPCFYSSNLFTGDRSMLPEHDPAAHVLLRLTNSEVVDTRSGDSVRGPHPLGMSGSPVWTTYRRDEAGRGVWDPEASHLVGVQSAYSERIGALRFIPWQFVEVLLQRVRVQPA